jgi:hypothetical protein
MTASMVNPRSGLATDYLNHFNEAIMLLEMIPDLPDCVDDFLTWQPKTYVQHFEASELSSRGEVIAAYAAAPQDLRAEFDRVTEAACAILSATADAMRCSGRDATRVRLARHAVDLTRPFLTQASGLINGAPAQVDVDALFASVNTPCAHG